MISSAPSAPRKEPVVSAPNSIKQAGGTLTWEPPIPRFAMDSGARSSRDSNRDGAAGHPVGGHPEAVTAWPVRLKRLPWPGRGMIRGPDDKVAVE
jgi:hypothetical protein